MIKDIIVMPTFRFHNLKGKLDGYFAIDVKTIRDKWRIVLQPLDEEENVFDPTLWSLINDYSSKTFYSNSYLAG